MIINTFNPPVDTLEKSLSDLSLSELAFYLDAVIAAEDLEALKFLLGDELKDSGDGNFHCEIKFNEIHVVAGMKIEVGSDDKVDIKIQAYND